MHLQSALNEIKERLLNMSNVAKSKCFLSNSALFSDSYFYPFSLIKQNIWHPDDEKIFLKIDRTEDTHYIGISSSSKKEGSQNMQWPTDSKIPQ